MQCKIDTTDRMNRILIGIALLGIVLLNLSPAWLIAIGVIELIEGLVARCALSCTLVKFRPPLIKQ